MSSSTKAASTAMRLVARNSALVQLKTRDMPSYSWFMVVGVHMRPSVLMLRATPAR